MPFFFSMTLRNYVSLFHNQTNPTYEIITIHTYRCHNFIFIC
jgi:hypothetical protein